MRERAWIDTPKEDFDDQKFEMYRPGDAKLSRVADFGDWEYGLPLADDAGEEVPQPDLTPQ